jgi:hypothetical protein
LELYYHHFEIAPRKGMVDFDVNQWQLKLNRSFLDDSWHTIGDDPFGLVSVHVAVSLIMKGPCYNDQPMEITLDLA